MVQIHSPRPLPKGPALHGLGLEFQLENPRFGPKMVQALANSSQSQLMSSNAFLIAFDAEVRARVREAIRSTP
jgi:hypothetical protein